MVEGPISQRDCTGEAGHDGAQTRLPGGTTIIFSYPEPAGMGNLAAEGRDLAFDDEPRVGGAGCPKPQRLRLNQAVEVIDNKSAHAISRYRIAHLILRQQP